ncbi:MAG: glycosyltransferase family 9 protein [Flavobacteriales bacterium]
MSNAAKILIIRFSSMGDIVLTTPVIRRLKQQLDGDIEIHFLTKKNFANLLEPNPYIAKVHAIDKSVQEVMPELLKEEFHYVIDLHSNIRSRIVKRRLKKLNFTFKKLNVKKWLLVNFGWNLMPEKHIVDRYLDALHAFGTTDDGQGLDYFYPENFEANLQLPNHYTAFAIGGAHIGKRMEAEKLIEIISQIPGQIVLLGGKEDVETANKIAASLPDVINGVGQWSIHQSAYASEHADLVITGDTGLMHIASAFGKNIISLWGCTTPSLGMYPYRPGNLSVIVEPHGRKKRPCSKLGNKCKYGNDNRCIQAISVEEVVAAAKNILNQTKP